MYIFNVLTLSSVVLRKWVWGLRPPAGVRGDVQTSAADDSGRRLTAVTVLETHIATQTLLCSILTFVSVIIKRKFSSIRNLISYTAGNAMRINHQQCTSVATTIMWKFKCQN